VYFASNGVEALRVALNRAYSVIEPRSWYWLRLESIGYTLVAAFTALAMAFLIVLFPLGLEAGAAPHPVLRRDQRALPQRHPLQHHHRRADRGAVHPARLAAGGRRGFLQILPGIIFTLVASLLSGIVFGQYLTRFASNYVTMYAGLRRSSSRWCFCISSPRSSSMAAN
jgi:membrane protein